MAARESLEQLVALGYIAKPDEDLEKAVADAIDELRYNLAGSYQDADRHGEALAILRELHQADPNEQRFAVHRFISCQALGLLDEMREIVADLDGRRRELYSRAQSRLEEFAELVRSRVEERKARHETANDPAEADQTGTHEDEDEAGEPGERGTAGLTEAAQNAEAILNEEERHELARCRGMVRFDPPVVDYLKAQVRATEGRHAEALELLERVQEAHLARPGLLLQTAQLFTKLRRWDEAEQTYSRALSIDPDNPHAHVGMSRLALRRRDFVGAAQSALDSLQRLYHYPMAHFLLGKALIGLRQFVRAAEAFRTALSLNPNFPEAPLSSGRIAATSRRPCGGGEPPPAVPGVKVKCREPAGDRGCDPVAPR